MNNMPSESIREPLKCWGYGVPHLFWNCPFNNNKNWQIVNNLQKDSTINNVARSILRINVSLDNLQAGHQSSMVEVEGKILQTSISISREVGSNLSYISSKIVKKWKLTKERHRKSWLIQLQTSTKIKVMEIVKDYRIDLNRMSTKIKYLNILHLGSYEVIIGMD